MFPTAASLTLAAILWPGFVWAGLGSATIPIIIHLLNKRRFRRVRWAATDFLMEAQRRNRRRVRIEELILLALRCLAMLLIGLMLARWFLRPEALLAVLGSAGSNERIVVLDDSFSMRHQPGGQGGGDTNFKRATTAVDRLIGWLREESPNDRLTIVLTSKPDTPLRTETLIGDIPPAELSEQLRTLEPSSRGGNMGATMAAVRSLIDEREGSLNATVYVLSDFQQHDWSAGGDVDNAGSPRGPISSLSGWTDQNRSLRVVLVDVGSPQPGNVAVTAIDALQPQVVTGLSARYIARVKNFSDTGIEAATLQVYVGDATQPAVPIPPIGPYETVGVPIEVTFGSEGSDTLGVELSPDALPTDDARSVAVLVKRALKVLIVNGEASPDPYHDEVFLMRVALRPEGQAFSGNELTVIDESEFEQADLGAYDTVVMANVYRLNEDIVERLERYVAAGGGVMIFLGDQVDPDLYNRLLYRDGGGAMPARLTEFMAAPMETGVVSIDGFDEQHPALRGFAGTNVPHFADIIVVQYIGCDLGGEATSTMPVAPAETEMSQPDRPAARVLMRLADDVVSPLLVERSFGKGRVLMFTSSVDKEWNNLADRPVYIVLLLELLQYSARSSDSSASQLVTEPIRLVLDPNRHHPIAMMKPPSFPEEPAIQLDAQPDPDTGLPTIVWDKTEEPGVYRFDLNETSGSPMTRLVSVSVDPRESDLRRIGKVMLLESMGDVPSEYVPVEELVNDDDVQARQELWPAVWLLLLTMLMAEQGLAWWFGGGRSAGFLTRKRP